MRLILQIIMSTFLYVIGLAFTLLRIYIELGNIPSKTWIYSLILYVLILPIITWFLYITDLLENKKGVIR
jgi:hypothetical protein